MKSRGRAAFVDSTLAGNDGNAAGIDVESVKKPRLGRSTCLHSAMLVGSGFTVGAPWGVCAAD